jgi:hypothetical protein
LDFCGTSLFYGHRKRKEITISPGWKGSGSTWEKRERRRGFQEGGAFMIRKVKGGYKVVSESGKNLGGPYRTKAAAQKRLRQVEYFKHRK